MARRERGDAHANEGAVGHIGKIGPHGENVVGNVMVLGHDHAERLGNLIAPDDGVVRPVDHAHDARSRAVRAARETLARAAGRQGNHLDQVAIESTAHLRLGDEILPLRRADEAERAGMHHQNAVGVAARAAARASAIAPHASSSPAIARSRWRNLSGHPARHRHLPRR